MKIIDYSTPEFRTSNSELRILELLGAAMIFIIPVLALFILSK